MATEWLVDDLKVTQAARKIEEASRPGEAEFRRLDDDANIVVFSILADSSTYCGNVRIQERGRRKLRGDHRREHQRRGEHRAEA